MTQHQPEVWLTTTVRGVAVDLVYHGFADEAQERVASPGIRLNAQMATQHGVYRTREASAALDDILKSAEVEKSTEYAVVLGLLSAPRIIRCRTCFRKLAPVSLPQALFAGGSFIC